MVIIILKIIYIYIHTYIYVHMHTYMHTHILVDTGESSHVVVSFTAFGGDFPYIVLIILQSFEVSVLWNNFSRNVSSFVFDVRSLS